MNAKETFKNFLLEMSYNQQGTLDRRFEEGNVTSNQSLIRLYDFLFEKKFKHDTVRFYKRKSTDTISGFIKINNLDYPEHTNKIIFNLTFYDEQTLRHKMLNALQVESVTNLKDYEGLGITSCVYLKLISNKNITIISDSTQFDDGKFLWKKMARESKVNNYKIRIFDDKTDEYLKDENDVVLEYDNENIDDALIWSTNKDYSKMDVLLVLSSK